MQTDPIFYADDMNMYAYVGNDPVNKTDPSGLAGGCFAMANGIGSVCAGAGLMIAAPHPAEVAPQKFADNQVEQGKETLKTTAEVGVMAGTTFVAPELILLKGATWIMRGAKLERAAPAIKWSAQEKHFPGHNSYTPGRSTMTANPERLAQQAGSGQQVGKVPVGEAGSKERVNFGEDIGTYFDQAGNGSTTTNGIIHYSNDGIHIVPARPNP